MDIYSKKFRADVKKKQKLVAAKAAVVNGELYALGLLEQWPDRGPLLSQTEKNFAESAAYGHAMGGTPAEQKAYVAAFMEEVHRMLRTRAVRVIGKRVVR